MKYSERTTLWSWKVRAMVKKCLEVSKGTLCFPILKWQ